MGPRAGILALVGTFLLVACGSASAPSASVATAEPTPTASTSAAASHSAAPSTERPAPSPSVAPPTPATALAAESFALVAADSLLIRDAPGLDGEPLVDGTLCMGDWPGPGPCERPFLLGTESGYIWLYLLDGPVQADGYDWYLSATEMLTEERASTFPEAVGWVAAGDGVDPWLVADVRPCPADPVALDDVTNLVLSKLERVHCLSGRDFSFRGWYPLPPSEAGDLDRQIAECRTQNHWLLCGSIFDAIRREQAGWAGNADYLEFAMHPAADVERPDRNQWITLTGHFDDPEAAACGDVGLQLMCRFTFVVTRIDPG